MEARKPIKITKRSVDAVIPGGKLLRIWDSELKGFGLRVMPTGVKSYFVMYRAGGGGRRENSKEYTIGKHGAIAPEEARRTAEKLLSGVRLGQDPHQQKQSARAELTISELCDLYMKEGIILKKASTLISDRTRIDRHIKPLLGQKKVSQISDADVSRFMSDVASGKSAVAIKPTKPQARKLGLKTKETRRRGDPVATGGRGTATRTVGLLGAIFSFAVKNKLCPTNPVHGVQRFKDRQSQRYLSPTELTRLGEALHRADLNPYGLAVIRLLILTGARKSEIEGLKWDEVNSQMSCLYLGDSKTGQKLIPIGAPALEALSQLSRSPTSPFVFPSSADSQKHYVGTPKVWEILRTEARLPGVRLHDLRHTFASLAAGGGQSLPIIGKILGHSDVKTTGRYAHLADDPLMLAVNRISALAATALDGSLGSDQEQKN